MWGYMDEKNVVWLLLRVLVRFVPPSLIQGGTGFFRKTYFQGFKTAVLKLYPPLWEAHGFVTQIESNLPKLYLFLPKECDGAVTIVCADCGCQEVTIKEVRFLTRCRFLTGY
jgi:hypothetical protein